MAGFFKYGAMVLAATWAVVAMVVTAGAVAEADPGERRASQTVEGVVEKYTTAPKGEIDGLILEDGTQVHWPPHLQKEFSALAKAGQRVRVVGEKKVGKNGDEKFEAQSLTNVETKATYERKEPEKKHEGKPAPKQLKTVEGVVAKFTTAPEGEVDGAILEDGTTVHWPPHLQKEFTSLAQKGQKIRVLGETKHDKEGVAKLEVKTLTNLETEATYEREEEKGKAHPKDKDDAKSKKKHHRKDDVGKALKKVEHELKELREEVKSLRQAIEKKS